MVTVVRVMAEFVVVTVICLKGAILVTQMETYSNATFATVFRFLRVELIFTIFSPE